MLLALTDTIDWPTAFLGCLKAGVIAVPVNTLLTEDDYRFMLADSRAKLLVVSEVLYPKFEKLIAEKSDFKQVIVSGDNAHGHEKFEDLITSVEVALKELVAKPSEVLALAGTVLDAWAA